MTSLFFALARQLPLFRLPTDAIGPRPFGNGFPELIARPPFRSHPHAQGRLADHFFSPWQHDLVGIRRATGRRRALTPGGRVRSPDRRYADLDNASQCDHGLRSSQARLDASRGGKAGPGPWAHGPTPNPPPPPDPPST